MDLIYTDGTGKDIGTMEAYTFDMAYGADENNFECTVDATDHCCEENSLIYVDGEEYGGVVDDIGVDSEAETVTYYGRTWHGILEGKVVSPPAGNDYLILSGEANSILRKIINMIGLSTMFEAPGTNSGIEIDFQAPRYIYAYTCIRKMLKEAGAKLHVEWKNGKVRLSAMPVMDYSQDEEYENEMVQFSLTKKYHPVNHIICLGQGDLAARAVIHIFTDENGGIQPYATTDDPQRDSDYIIDESQKVLTGKDEVTEILDYPSAEITENYLALSAEPADWKTACDSYYLRSGSEYKAVEWGIVEYELQKKAPYDWDINYSKYFTRSGSNYSPVAPTTMYTLTPRQPSDWTQKYEKYFTKSGSTYSQVQSVTIENYQLQAKIPNDWKKKYASYYVFYSDGVTSEYRTVSGIQYNSYAAQTQRPTDWAERFGEYYRKGTAKELEAGGPTYRAVEAVTRKTIQNDGEVIETQGAPTWEKRKYYTKLQKTKAPDWAAESRYTQIKTVEAPTWSANTYYEQEDHSPPTWQGNTYYTKVDEKVAPKWTSGKYFRKVLDRYAVMVANAIERLEEAHESEPMEISMDDSAQTRDVGDMVSMQEPNTGISETQEIVKKIIKIENGDVKIKYEVK